MKATDRSLLAGLMLLLLAVVFWFMVLGPKREKAAELTTQVETLEAEVDEQESVAAFAEQARNDFPKYYGRLVVLGKAVPDQADSASLLVQVSATSQRAGVEFRSIELGEGSGAATAPAPAPADPSVAEQASSPSATEVTPEGGTTTAAAAPAPATEASAATLPIGSTVGPAGLPVLGYDLKVVGDFFNMADLFGGIDEMIRMRSNGQVAADGRLLTINGFSLVADPALGFPNLQASVVVSAYATPSTQGLTLGASPTAPGPALAPETVPASTVVAP